MTLYTLEPDRKTLHGYFSREREPVLTIDPGDTVRYRTLDAGWGLEPPPPDVNAPQRRKFELPLPEDAQGHALLGPIAITGARAGMVLEIQIGTIIPGAYGYTQTAPGDFPVTAALNLQEGDSERMVWTLDANTMTGTNQHGHRIALSPFPGVLGMPPPEPGRHSTIPPRIWGGNLDCKELVSGTTLYLPIPVDGALFSAGDGHAAQGDGEVCITAIECPFEKLDLTFYLRDDLSLKTPRARTPDSWLTLGMDTDLHQAAMNALDAMLDIIMHKYSISRKQAYALSSVAVDLRITQLANGTLGVHAILPDTAIYA